jgi:hypothetical protein
MTNARIVARNSLAGTQATEKLSVACVVLEVMNGAE